MARKIAARKKKAALLPNLTITVTVTKGGPLWELSDSTGEFVARAAEDQNETVSLIKGWLSKHGVKEE